MLPENLWDAENNKIKSRHPNSKRLNSFIANKYTELQDHVFEHETITKSLSSRNLKEKIYGKAAADFFSLADDVCERYLREEKIGTHGKAIAILNKLKEYVNNKSITFSDITPEFLEKYEDHLRIHHHNKVNTIHRDMKFFRMLYNEAYRRNLIEHHQIPFLRYKIRQEKTERTFLTEEELLKIESLNLKNEMPIEAHRDMFVFACYCGGLRVSDVLQLRWENFDGHHINLTIRKTRQQLSIKIPDKALAIILKYKPKKIKPEEFIFPVLSIDLNFDDARAVAWAISRATAYVNKNLKRIAKKSGISKNIHFHVSRHSWAVRALRKGISIDKVSKLMGHSAIKETMVYAKIMSEELDRAMEIFNE